MFGAGAAPVLDGVGYYGRGRGRYDVRGRVWKWRDSGLAQSDREGRQAGGFRMPVRFTRPLDSREGQRFAFGA